MLTDFVASQRKQREEKERLLDEGIRLIQAHHEEFGLWGEEFSTL